MITAIYARKSTEQNGVADEERSVTRQIEHATAYAMRKGWAVVPECVFVDDGISGAEFATRPGFLRLMNSLKPRPPFQVLVMSEESRLGREAIETAYALKQIVTAGVRVFFYLEDRERTLDSPTDKIMLSLTAFADELEREKARQRTYDAMLRKAEAGHVTGGRVFGYDNIDVLSDQVDAAGRAKRVHVERRIREPEAAVVRRIFELCAAGNGMRQIAYKLNAEGALSPRPQQDRPKGWAPSSIRAILYRPIYRGEIVWNRTRKRNTWGQAQPRRRPEREWMRRQAPDLRIVTDAQWKAAHARLGEARALYLRASNGQVWGHPARGTESKYLLVGLSRCAVCGAGLSVRSRAHGKHRAYYYVCTANYHRSSAVCPVTKHCHLDDLNGLVIDAIADQLLSTEAIERIVSRVVEGFRQMPAPDRELPRLHGELTSLDKQLANLTGALALGGDVPSILAEIKRRENQKADLQARIATCEQAPSLAKLDPAMIAERARAKVDEYRDLLGRQVAYSRQMLRKLVVGRVDIEQDGERTVVRGMGTLEKLFGGVLVSQGVASPAGVEPAFRP